MGDEEIGIKVDLDAGLPRRRNGNDNVHHVKIIKAQNGRINLSTIKAYLDGKMEFDTPILEAISQSWLFLLDIILTRYSDFLDHLLRETPSKKLINLRRSYFARTGETQDRVLLGGGIEAMKGVYQSIRMAEACLPIQ